MAEDTKQDEKTEQKEEINLARFMSSMRLSTEISEPVQMLQDEMQTITEAVSDEDRVISGLAALLYNIDITTGRFEKGMALEAMAKIDQIVSDQVNEIIHNAQFKEVESDWRSLDDLIKQTNFKADIMIDILDVSKDELYEDFEDNSVDITGSNLLAESRSAPLWDCTILNTRPGTNSGFKPWERLQRPAIRRSSVRCHPNFSDVIPLKS
jgi:type VI secretion system protein ImpC